jgi:hypothetical protein
MIDTEKKSISEKESLNLIDKDDELAQKGKTSHQVETHWPTKESIPANSKKRRIKNSLSAGRSM